MERLEEKGDDLLNRRKDGSPIGIMDPDALIEVEGPENGILVYHYAQKMVWGTCYYHVILYEHSKLPISWDFDYEKGDPKKVCLIAG